MAAKKVVKTPIVETKICLCCGEEKSSKASNNKFYTHRNVFVSDKFSICKECVEKIGAHEDMQEVHLLLRLMDLPFIPEKWEDCIASENTLMAYMGGKGINIPRARYHNKTIMDMHYVDSPTCQEITDVQTYLISSDEQKLENMSKWGEHYSDAEYMRLNVSVENNIKVTGRDDYQSIKNFERVARAEIERDRAYANNTLRPTDKKSAEDNVTNMMKQAGLSYDKLARNAESTLGTDIRDVIENYEPVPQPLDEFKDVDGMGTYFYKFVLKPMMRVMGKDSSRTIDDYYEVREEILRKKTKFSGGDEE